MTWKQDCSYSCGNEFVRFNDTYPEEADGTAYPPACTASGLPSGALIVDDVADGTPSVRPGCANSDWKNEGTFSLDFGDGEAGLDHDGNTIVSVWPGKADLQQLGAGFGGHFYFAHTRSDDAKGQRLKTTATWKLGKELDSEAKVLVHVPDHGAQTQDASYRVKTAQGWKDAPPVNQLLDGGEGKNRWVSLGAYQFGGTVPEVQTDTIVPGGTGDDDIAFDAVAFVPGDYAGIPDDLTFSDPDVDVPDPDLTDQKKVDIPTPPANFGGAVVSKTVKTPATMSTQATWGSCPITGSVYDRYTACLKSTTPLTFVVVKDDTPMEAKFNVDQQIQLAQDSKSIDERITITAVSIDPGLGGINLDWNTNCIGNCTAGQVSWAGTPEWTGAADKHSVDGTRSSTWTGSGKNDLSLESILTGVSPQGSATTFWSDSDLGIRCDNTVVSTAGCVFNSYKPTYTMNSKKYPAAAAHAWLIQHQLPGHFGLDGQGDPLRYIGADVLAPGSDKKMNQANREVICPTSWTRNQKATLSPELNKTSGEDTWSCDEFPFASSYQSAGMPTEWGGLNPNPVTSGDACVTTYAKKDSDGKWRLHLDERSPVPTWNESCGRASMSNNQNTQSMQPFGAFINENRLIDGDSYWLNAPKP